MSKKFKVLEKQKGKKERRKNKIKKYRRRGEEGGINKKKIRKEKEKQALLEQILRR